MSQGGVGSVPQKPLVELKAQVGDSYRVVEGFEIEAGKVEEYARALGEDDPVYRDETEATRRGFDSIPAPLTFSWTANFPRYRPDSDRAESDRAQSDLTRPFDLGLRWENCVHGEHELEFERPMTVGDVLSGEVTLTEIHQREGKRGGTLTFAVFEFEYRDQTGEPVLVERLTVIETSEATAAGADE